MTGLPTPFAEAVLDLVARIPRGSAMSYSDVAAALGSGGARAVGTVMAKFGSGVPWHRVVRADGSLPVGHEPEALRRHRGEGTPLAASGTRLDLSRARWQPDRRPAVESRQTVEDRGPSSTSPTLPHTLPSTMS